MAVYEYKGLDGSGATVTGLVDAESAKAARLRVRTQGVFPTEVKEQQGDGGATRGRGLAIEVDLSRVFSRITVQDLATMSSQLATMIGGAVPMASALNALVEQTEKPPLKVVLADVREKVNEGAALADAMKGHPKVFGDLFISMIRAGEASGSLETVLERLTEYTESQVRLRGKIQAAMIYPILMTVVGGLIVLGLFTFVIPKIRRIFDSFGEALPLITRVVLAASEVFLGWWWLFVILAIAGVVAFRRWVATEEGRMRWHRMQLRAPVFGRIVRIVAISRFCRTLSTLLASGVPILTALGIVQEVVGNAVLAEAVAKASRNISEGQSVAVPLKESGEFPPLVTHMIAIGEQTGELESMLSRIADAYDLQVENAVAGLTALLEPLLILTMASMTAIVAVAILLPMLNLSNIAR